MYHRYANPIQSPVVGPIMFRSFFPKPTWFLISFLLWSCLAIFIWATFKVEIGSLLGLDTSDQEPVIGVGHFSTDTFLLLYAYYTLCTAIFGVFWMKISPHRWQLWSIFGTSFILFTTYFSVQVSVAINAWRRPFFDSVQNALDPDTSVPASDLYGLIIQFAEIAFLATFVFVITRFVVSHYIFRWRSAMNEYYTANWTRLREVEGASQRVQEDTMIFAKIMETLGVALVDSVMTLFAFLPILWSLSAYVETLPIVGAIPYPLFFAALFWSIFGTGLLALVGIKLPGLEFRNQRVEAAYRKELVYGEDSAERAAPPTLVELFGAVRRNYFRLYFHYMYFNVARGMYIQADNIFAYFILIPTIAAGAITFGILQQILTAFSQVSASLQYLVTSWTTIVELLSVHKRLSSFERAIEGEEIIENYAVD